MTRFEQRQRDRERARLREEEKKDLEVEANRGPRPLEGMSHGPTTWAGEQDDRAAEEEHGADAAASWDESEGQVYRLQA
jgi:hypothetical protein